MSYKYGEGEIGVFMPCINLEKAKQTAKILKARAGIEHKLVIAFDQERRGFIAVVNALFKDSNYKYVVYTAEDAFPGINWLKIAHNELEKSGKGLLAFNDGKWFGQLAAFGMVRSAWAKTNYASSNLFFESYKSHYADNELTDRAVNQGEFCYNPNALLMEVDYNKHLRWESNCSDKELYLPRKIEYKATTEYLSAPKASYSAAVDPERVSGKFDKYEILNLIHHIFKPRNYLEIGVQFGKSLRLAKCVAYGVDPDPKINFDLGPLAKVFRKTSDEFFKNELNLPPFDLSFIDGVHLFEFALRDFMNAEKRSSKGGFIVIGDIFPSHPLQGSRERKTRHWAGDIWRLYRLLQAVRKDLYFFPIDARPTGLLLISNIDPNSKYTYQDYIDFETEINKVPTSVPETIINRVDIPLLSFEQISRNLLNISTGSHSVSLRGALSRTRSPNNSEVPIFIINRNRLTSLRALISWLAQRGYNNIKVLDNDSSYEPLLEFYQSSGVNVIKLGVNIGPRQSATIDEVKSTKVPYIITDSDVIPSTFCPDDVIEHMFEVIEDQPEILKVGPSLRIDDLPDFYEEKAKVVRWESHFWGEIKEESPSFFFAPIDTTFALYRPGHLVDSESKASARLGFPYCFSHSPWYVDYSTLSEEEQFYRNNASSKYSYYSTSSGVSKLDGLLRRHGL